MIDEFERTWTFPEMVRALASSPPLPGLTPLSRDGSAHDEHGRAAPTAQAIARLLESMQARRLRSRR